MSAAYDALLASQNPAIVILAEMQPAEALGPWTNVSGSLYSVPFLSVLSLTVVPGGIYRRLDRVQQDGTLLTLRASSALVSANPGSYFLDTTANLLYVSSTTGSSPNVFSSFAAWFTLFFSTGTMSFVDQPLYLPILSDNLPVLSAEMPDLLFGDTISTTGTLTLSNADKLFDQLSRRFVWRNKVVTLKLGGTGLAYSDFTTIATGRINNVQVDDASFVVTLEDLGSLLNQSIPPKTWGDQASFLVTTSDPGTLGQSAPWLFGTVKDCPLTLTGPATYNTIDSTVLSVQTTILAVYAINKTTGARTLIVNGSDYTHDPNGLQVTIVNTGTYPDSGFTFRADLQDFSPTTTDTVGGFAQQFLLRCGELIGNINTTAFAAADVACPLKLGVFLNSAQQAVDVLQNLQRSTLTQIYRGADGKWTIRVLDPSFPDHTLTDTDFVTWTPAEDLTAVLSVVRQGYAANPTTGDVLQVAGTFSEVAFQQETSDSASFVSYVQNAADAGIAMRHQLFFKTAAPSLIAFEERGLTMMGAQVGDYVAVTRSRAPNARNGKYDGQLLRIVKIVKTLGPVPIVTGVLNDLGGRCDQIFRLAPSGSSMTWSTATDAQRAKYGFLADANGYFTDGTRNLKVLY